MPRHLVASACIAMALAGCASIAPREAPPPVPWLDQAFQHAATRVQVRPEELFVLPDDLRALLDASPAASVGSQNRLNHLLTLLFGADRKGFAYAAGHSTVAAETWRLRKGDCLSLTILTYAVARHSGMAAQMQQVPSPMVFDRRGGYDVVSQHVNVLLPAAVRNILEDPERRDMVVDFDPVVASGRRGTPLNEAAIAARYYNNVAVEAMAAGDTARAYAHFKAAATADPAYASAYTNLAALYRSGGHVREAEELLRTAIRLADEPHVPLHALHQLLTVQGRDAEARPLALRLQALREQDPYHWIGTGLRHLQLAEHRQAIAAFERARDLAAAFPEVHRHLAVAYARSGQLAKAEEALRELATLGERESKIAALRRKLGRGE